MAILFAAAPAQAQTTGTQLNVKLDRGAMGGMNVAQQDGVVQTGITSMDQLHQQYGVVEMRRIFRPAGKFEERHRAWGLDRWYRIEVRPGTDVEGAARAYLADPAIEAASPVYEKTLHGKPTFDVSAINGPTREAAVRMEAGSAMQFVPDDPLYGSQWHYDNTGQTNIPEDGETGTPNVDVNLPEAHDIQTGSSEVIVSIVDSGLDLDHPDFQGALWINEGEDINGNGVFDRTPASEGGDLNGVDDDGNGYVDDVVGYDFADDDPIPDTFDPSVIDNSHGTHVAGTVAARNNNGTGVAGVAGGDGTPESGVRLMITQTFSSTVDGFAEAVVYAADNGAVISNNSWGYTSPGVFEQPVLDAIDYFNANAGGPDAPIDGGIYVTSAGNSNSSADYYPGFYEGSFNVSSTEDTDTKSSFSNYGEHVDVAAPGGQFGIDGVISTLHTSQLGGYGSFSGTSMAAPHIAGAAGLIASEMPGMSADVVKALLANSGVDVSDLNPGFLLGRRLDAFNALQGPDEVAPAAITDLAIETPAMQAIGTSITLTWTAPGDDGDTGTAESYDLRYSETGPITEATFADAIPVDGVPAPAEAGTAESFTVEGLPFDTELWFAIRASDEFLNTSPVSNSPSLVTEQGPEFSVSTDSVGTSLLIGDTGTASFSVTNDGTEELAVDFFGFAALELLSQPGIETNNVSAPVQSTDHAKGSDGLGGVGYPVLLGAGGPDDFGYNWIDSNEDGGPAFDWIDISGDGTPVSAGDETVTSVPLPFNFSFYGETYSDVGIGSNGYLIFDGSASEFTNATIPSPAAPNAIIAPFWDDLDPSSAGAIYTRYDEAEDRFIVQYDDVAKFFSTNRYTFQVILYADGTIKFQYETMDPADSATIGVENATGSDGLQVVFNAPYAEDGLAVAIQTAPQYLTLSPTSASLSGGASETFTVGFDATDLDQGLYDYTLRGSAANASSSASVAIQTGLDVTGAPYPLELSLTEIDEALNADESVERTLTVSNPTMREQNFRVELRGMSGIAPTYEPRLKGEQRLKYDRMAESLKKLAGTSRPELGANASGGDAPAFDFLPEPMAELNLDAFSSSVFGTLADQFVRFDLGDPESLFALDSSPTIFAGDFAVGQQDRFYVITNADNAFHSITTGGSITTFGESVPQTSGETWTEVASNPVDGTLYGSTSDGSASYLYTIDPTSGAATRVAEIEGAPIVISIAVDDFGRMYGLEIGSDVLLEIDPETGETETIGSVGFDANFAQGMDFDLATGRLYMAAYNNAGGGRGELRIADRETGATTLVGLLGGGDELGYLALNSVGFVRSNLLAGTIAPQNSVDLDLVITAEGLYEGTYTGELAVISDVPGEPAEEVMVTLEVDAEGALALDVDALTYDSLFIGNDQTQTVLVSNTGRAAIDLALSIDNGDFTFEESGDGAFTLPAGVSREVEVTFAPSSVGTITGTLTVDGAPGGAQTVALSGEGLPAPEVELSPAEFDLQAYPGQTYTRTLTMSNPGGSPLEYTSSETVVSDPGSSVAPSAVFVNVLMEEDFDDGIPSEWSVVDNTDDGVVWQTNDDWGRGNFAGTGGSAAADSDEAGPGVPYDTELISPEMTGVEGMSLRFLVNFQAIPPENFFDVDVTTDGGTTWTNVLQLDDDTPSGGLFVENGGVQQVIPLDGQVAAGETFQVRFRYYTPDPSPWDWYAQIDDVQIAQSFEYVAYEPASGTVQPGESLDLTFSIDATGLPGGTYDVEYTFNTNAPETPTATVPFTLNVIESLAVTPDPQVGDDGIVHPNETFTVPVLVESLDDLAVQAYEMTLAFDGDVLEPVAVETEGTLSEGLTLVSNLGDDTVQIAAAEDAATTSGGPTPVLFDIEGEGTLVNVTFRAEEVLSTSDITVSDVRFNEGQPAATGGSASVEVAPLYGDASLNVFVNAQDAAIALQHAAGIVTLDGPAFISADVTGDGTVGAFDAALILQFASEIITCFPVEEGCETSPALASKSGGSAPALAWGTPAFDAAKSESGEQRLRLPLTLEQGSTPVYAFQVVTSIDASLGLEAVESALPEGWSLLHNVGDDGQVTLAAAGTRPLPTGTVARLDLAWTPTDDPIGLMGTAVVNEASAKSMTRAELTPRPEEFALKGNYPNPFATATQIAMDLPQDARIDVEVYDLLGRRVQSIRGTSLSAGSDRTIQIDGSRLSAGVYFYRLTVQMGDKKQTDTGRMTVVR
ncbi:S8 family serine peptidase [Longibacter sp.]|uniref:S8 family serine peptidase n=1 Tax=Longibacter sp. TaxID=2045415 RepID=UPI003EB82B54